MPPKTKRQRKDGKDISLRDVVIHMTGMEQRLSAEITSIRKATESNTKEIRANAVAIQDVKETLTQRIDALEEDLTATILDTVKIRQHVGMPVPSES